MHDFDIQPAKSGQSADLAILADMASRGLNSYFWSLSASEGQSRFEVGRSSIYGDQSSTLHYRNWQIAWAEGALLGALNGYVLSEGALATPSGDSGRVLAPLNELKAMAIGAWYIAAIAVFPEARGNQVGKSLLRSAEHDAQLAGAGEIALMVGSFNTHARNLYDSLGYVTRGERAFEPFAGSDRDGHWILMSKSLKGGSE